MYWSTLGEIKDGVLRIGETSISVGSGHDAAAMVPNVLFYDNELVRQFRTAI